MDRDQAQAALRALARDVHEADEAAAVGRVLERIAGSEPEVQAAALELGVLTALRDVHGRDVAA